MTYPPVIDTDYIVTYWHLDRTHRARVTVIDGYTTVYDIPKILACVRYGDPKRAGEFAILSCDRDPVQAPA